MNSISVRRLSVLALGLFPVLSSLVAPTRASLLGVGHVPVRSTPRVPYPGSVQLLESLLGGRHVHPPVVGTRYPETFLGRPAFDPHESAALLELLFLATRRQQEELEILVRLGRLAAGLGDEKYRPTEPEAWPHLAAIDEVAWTTRFQGLRPLSGEVSEVFLFRTQSGLEPLTLELRATDEFAFGLSGANFDTPRQALNWLDPIDGALDSLTSLRTHLIVTERALRTEPEPGLVEVERTLRALRSLAEAAAQGTLNTFDRGTIDEFFQSDLERLAQVGELTRYLGQPLLEGGDAWLGCAEAGYLHLFLPELPGLSGAEVTTLTAAEQALTGLDGAIATVQEERARLTALLPVLSQQLGHPERR